MNTCTLSKIKYIPQFDQDVVYGYVKIIHSDEHNNVPPLVSSLCLLFYYEHGFDRNLYGFRMELSNDNTIVTNRASYSYHSQRRIPEYYQTCYGKHIISSTLNATYIWRLKNLTKENDKQSIYIGITDSNSNRVNDLFAPNKWKTKYLTIGYAASCGGLAFGWKKQMKNGQYFNKNNDIITMKVIIKNSGMSIRFKINDNDETTLFDKLYQNENMQYRLAISMKGYDQTVQFIDFKRIPYDPQSDDDQKEQKERSDSDGPHYNYVTRKYIDSITEEKADKILYQMDCLLYKLSKLLTNEFEFSSCMNTLKLVTYNLKRRYHPNEDMSKYRKLNLKNRKLKERLFKYEPAMNLLILIGFVKKMDHLVFEAHNDSIGNITVINSFYHKLHIYHHSKHYGLDYVYDINIHEIDDVSDPIVKIEKNIRIYLFDDLKKFKINESKIMMQEAANNNDKSLSYMRRKYMRSRQNAFNRLFPKQLMGKDLREKRYGIKQRVYEFTLIRIEFPSSYVLEVRFNINDPIYKLFEFVDSMLENDIEKMKYKLILAPNETLKNMNNDEQTFKKIGGMIPGCTLRFRLNIDSQLNYKGKYIANEMIEKYLTKSITSLKLIKLNNDENNVKDCDESAMIHIKSNNGKHQNSKERMLALKKKRVLLRKLAKLNKKYSNEISNY